MSTATHFPLFWYWVILAIGLFFVGTTFAAQAISKIYERDDGTVPVVVINQSCNVTYNKKWPVREYVRLMKFVRAVALILASIGFLGIVFSITSAQTL